jgi:1-acyl-sn-glycerol-3-phosphate acyltransferase
LKKILLNLYYWPMLLMVTIIGIIVAPGLLLGNMIFPRMPVARLARLSVRIYGWILIRVVPFMAPVVLEDRSGGFPKPAIFIPNHNSSIDPYLFGMLPMDTAFVTSWPFKIPLYSFFMRLAGYIDSTNGWEHVQRAGTRLLESGCSLIIWPEGHRSRDGRLRRFKNGAFQLALAANRPIIPVCIVGSRQILAPGKRLLSPARVKVILLPAIMPSGSSDNPEDIMSLKTRTKEAIGTEMDKHAPFFQSTATPEPNSNQPQLVAVLQKTSRKELAIDHE